MHNLNPLYGYDMMSVNFIGLILMFVVVVIPVVLACLFLVFLLVRKAGNGGAAPNANETKLIQEIHQGLLRMEQRIEALETIVLEAGERNEA